MPTTRSEAKRRAEAGGAPSSGRKTGERPDRSESGAEESAKAGGDAELDGARSPCASNSVDDGGAASASPSPPEAADLQGNDGGREIDAGSGDGLDGGGARESAPPPTAPASAADAASEHAAAGPADSNASSASAPCVADPRDAVSVRKHAGVSPSEPPQVPSEPSSQSLIPASQREACKLFVGRLPFSSTEDELRPLFGAYGTVRALHIITRANASKGCAFVTFSKYDQAKGCIDALHNQVTLPGGPGPLQISLARGEAERLGVTGSHGDEACKLFFGMLPYSYTDGDIRELLSPSLVPSDCVEMVHILRKNGGHGAPLGSAFVRVRGKDKATRIIDMLNGKVQLPGAPNLLNVSFAQARSSGSAAPARHGRDADAMGPRNTRKRRRQDTGLSAARHGEPSVSRSRADSGSASQNLGGGVFKLYVANLAFRVDENDLSRLFGRYGRVLEVHILRERNGSGRSKGAAFIKYGTNDEAEQAIQHLDGTIQWGYERPVRVSFALEGRGAKSSGRGNVPAPPRRRPHPHQMMPRSGQTFCRQPQLHHHDPSSAASRPYYPPPRLRQSVQARLSAAPPAAAGIVSRPPPLLPPPHRAAREQPYDSWGQQYNAFAAGAPPPRP